MRKKDLIRWAIAASAVSGCSTMGPSRERHPGIEEPNPQAVNRVYHASATRVAQVMGRVMANDSILEDVKVTHDPSRESRAFAAGEREKLGISRAKVGTRDVNFDITAKSKDGHRVGAVVALKGDSDAEISLLYGAGGDPEMSRALLDEVDAALAGPAGDPEVAQTSAPATDPRPSARR